MPRQSRDLSQIWRWGIIWIHGFIQFCMHVSRAPSPLVGGSKLFWVLINFFCRRRSFTLNPWSLYGNGLLWVTGGCQSVLVGPQRPFQKGWTLTKMHWFVARNLNKWKVWPKFSWPFWYKLDFFDLSSYGQAKRLHFRPLAPPPHQKRAARKWPFSKDSWPGFAGAGTHFQFLWCGVCPLRSVVIDGSGRVEIPPAPSFCPAFIPSVVFVPNPHQGGCKRW